MAGCPAMIEHHRTCNLCEANCGLRIAADGRQVLSIQGDPEDPLSRGYLCPKAYALKDTWEDPNRLRRPFIREGSDWREASWDEAIETAAAGIHEVQRRHGKDAVAVYAGNPSVHNLPAMVGNAPFIRALGTKVRFSASSADQFPRMLAAYLFYGGQFSIPVPDVDRTDYFLVIGANPVVSNGSLLTAPGMRKRLRAIRARGGKVVVIDPRRTETARLASEHAFLRPGTDALLLLAMLAVIAGEGLVDFGAASEYVEGAEDLFEAAERFQPDRVSEATGIEAATIRRLAKEFAAAPSAAAYGRIGTCVQPFGTLANFLIDVLNACTGRLDRAGGVAFPTPAAGPAPRGHYGRWRSRVRGIPEFGGELPVAVMSEEMTTPGPGQVRALVTIAGNPVLSTPNGGRLEEALAGLEFMVSIDPYLNETTRWARVVLPPRHSLQNDQFSLVFQRLAVRNTAKFSLPVFEPQEHELSEWEIFGRLATALDRLRAADPDAGLPAGASGAFSACVRDVIDGLLAAGPYELSVATLLEHPSGVDLGPLQPGRLEEHVLHEDGRLHMAPPEILGEIDRLEKDLCAGRFDSGTRLLLVGRRQLRSNNSWMHGCPSLASGRDRCTLLIHPRDAAGRGVTDGAVVRVRSRVGEVNVTACVTDEMMPGVVSLPHGYGHDRPGTRVGVAARRPGVSMNDLTDEQVVEGLLGNAVLTGVPVEVVPVGRAEA